MLALLHPFMPFLTEELWRQRGEGGPDGVLLALAAWPEAQEIADPDAEAEIGWLVELVSEIRSIRSELGVPPASRVVLALVSPSAETAARAERWSETLRRMARVSEVETVSAPPPRSVQVVIRGEVAALPLEGVVDLEAETARLVKERGKLDGEIAKIDAKLGNADFLARAPEEVVEEQRERRAEAEARRARIDEALARLKDVT